MAKNESELEMEDENGEAVGSLNDDRIAMLNGIADNADEIRAEEMQGIGPEDEEQPFNEEDEPSVEEQPQKFKIKVNGQEKEHTIDELLTIASKVEAADEYLAYAKRQSEEVRQPSQDVAQESYEDDDLALARALQMGSEEEAANVIRKIRSSSPSVSTDDIAAKAVDRIRFETDAKWFQEEYKDIFEDPFMKKLAIDADAEQVSKGDTRPYRERFASIGDELRTWRGTTPSFNQKQERKSATITNIPTASARSAVPVEEEPDDTPTSVIAKMAQSRGQR